MEKHANTESTANFYLEVEILEKPNARAATAIEKADCRRRSFPSLAGGHARHVQQRMQNLLDDSFSQ